MWKEKLSQKHQGKKLMSLCLYIWNQSANTAHANARQDATGSLFTPYYMGLSKTTFNMIRIQLKLSEVGILDY